MDTMLGYIHPAIHQNTINTEENGDTSQVMSETAMYAFYAHYFEEGSRTKSTK